MMKWSVKVYDQMVRMRTRFNRMTFQKVSFGSDDLFEPSFATLLTLLSVLFTLHHRRDSKTHWEQVSIVSENLEKRVHGGQGSQDQRNRARKVSESPPAEL